MNKILKTASLSLCLILILSVFSSCRNEKEITKYYDLIKTSCELSIPEEDGEVMVVDSVTPEADVEGVVVGQSSEIYVKFFAAADGYNFDYSKSTEVVSTGERTFYDLMKNDEAMLEVINGQGSIVEDVEIPDFFKWFKIDFSVDDIKNIEVETQLKGVKAYKVEMNSNYADKFDTDISECNSVCFTYSIDPSGSLTNVRWDIKSTLTTDAGEQTVLYTADAKIA